MSRNVNLLTPVCAATAMCVAAQNTCVQSKAPPVGTGEARHLKSSRGYGIWVVVTTPPEIDSELAGNL